MKRLDIIYGLSNSGKTTLCKNIEDAFYINIGFHPEFKKISMIDIVKKVYEENKSHDYYVTEACLYKEDYRNDFISQVASIIKPDILNIFYLHIEVRDLPRIAARSKIPEIVTEKYKAILSTLKTGSTSGNHYIIPYTDLENRLEFIKTK